MWWGLSPRVNTSTCKFIWFTLITSLNSCCMISVCNECGCAKWECIILNTLGAPSSNQPLRRHHSSRLKTRHKFGALFLPGCLMLQGRFFLTHSHFWVCVRVCVFSSEVYPTVLPPCWQATVTQARTRTHWNTPGSWPQGQSNSSARNSDWLEYQWWELNPKQLLTRDIKQSGEFSRGGGLIIPTRETCAGPESDSL